MNNLASVVITTFNGSKYIVDQLESIYRQDYPNIEVIVLDDNSTDNTVELVNIFIEENCLGKSWKLISNKQNVGWRKNFFNGLCMATGAYIFPCDQDDIWVSNKVSLMIYEMEKNKKINVLASNIIEFDEVGNERIRPLKEKNEVLLHPLSSNFFNNEYPGCSFCVRAEFFNSIKKYWWEDVPHDALLWRYSMFSDSLYTISVSLIRQRIHQDSTYRVESLKRKNKSGKYKEIHYMEYEIEQLKKFVSESGRADEFNCILNQTDEWLKARLCLLNRFSILNLIKLLKYINCYERKRKFVLDVLFSFDNTRDEGVVR